MKSSDTEPNRPSVYALSLLVALQYRRSIYGGTVPDGVKAQRRAKNRAARKSRRINRGR